MMSYFDLSIFLSINEGRYFLHFCYGQKSLIQNLEFDNGFNS